MKNIILLSISVLLMSSCSQESKLRETKEKLWSQFEAESVLLNQYSSELRQYEKDYELQHGTLPSIYSDTTYDNLRHKEEYHLYRSIGIMNDIEKVDQRLKDIELGL